MLAEYGMWGDTLEMRAGQEDRRMTFDEGSQQVTGKAIFIHAIHEEKSSTDCTSCNSYMIVFQAAVHHTPDKYFFNCTCIHGFTLCLIPNIQSGTAS